VIELPTVEEVVPHAAPMLLLDSLLEAGDDYLLCAVTVRDDGLFDDQGRIPGWLGVEYMAQAIAAFSGLQSYRRGEPAKLGFLLGTRRFSSDRAFFYCGEELTVRVERVVQDGSGMAAFDCRIEGRELAQVARLSVFEPADAGAFLNSESENVG
jgi:predicted hotdog family 3-hydroxylacyl-ACP dehydratase